MPSSERSGPHPPTTSAGSRVATQLARARPLGILPVAMRLDPAIGGSTASTISNVIAEQRSGLSATMMFCAGSTDELRTRPVVDRLVGEGIDVVRLPRMDRPQAAAAQFGLSRSATTWLTANVATFDLVHVHGPWGATSLCALTAATVHGGVPRVLTPRESLTIHDRDTSQSWIRAVAKSAAWRVLPSLTDMIIYTSEVERAGSRIEGRKGARVIYHAVVDGRSPIPSRHLRPDTGSVAIGFLGRFDPKKNLHLLIEALSVDPRVHLLLAGSGDDAMESALRAQVRELGLSQRATFLGYIGPTDREKFFSDIDVLALPSNFENFGMAAAEAMAHGIPVVVAAKSGIAEIVQELGGGEIVDLDPVAIAQAAIEMARLGRQSEFVASVQRIAQESFSFRAHAHAMTDIYEQLLDEAKVGPPGLRRRRF